MGVSRMTKGQRKTLIKKFNCLDYFLKNLKKQKHIKNPDVVEEIRVNIQAEIDRLISLEAEE